MPTYNQIQTSRLEAWVKKVLGVRNGGILPTVAPELSVELSLPPTPDTYGVSGSVPFGAEALTAAGGAGTFGTVNIKNLSSTFLISTRILAGSGSGVAPLVHAVSLPGGLALGLLAAGQSAWTDLRRAPASFPLNAAGIEITHGTLAALPPAPYTAIARLLLAVNVQAWGPWVVLPPQSSLAVWTETANQSLHWTIEGYVREFVPDELVI